MAQIDESALAQRHDGATRDLSSVFSPAALPSGATLPNRLVKVAMYEHMASLFGGPPNDRHFGLYSQWSRGDWGMVITGNVQVSHRHLTLGRDIVIPRSLTENSLDPFRKLALAMRGRPSSDASGNIAEDSNVGKTLIVMQLSHAGRQSPTILGGRLPPLPALAPSPIRLGDPRYANTPTKDGRLSRAALRLMFPTPAEMTVANIDEVVESFVRGATVALQCGFDGIELHAAHGYLISQFLSPQSNTRQDDYSADLALQTFLRRIVTSIRAIVPSKFVVGVKVSSADYVGAGSGQVSEAAAKDAEKRALDHVVEIARWGLVDFIEISGGDYQNPEFMLTSRQAFFARFARLARDAIHSLPSTSSRPPPLVLLTGGLRSPTTLVDVLSNGHADLLGIGRGSVLCPQLPRLLADQLNVPQTDGPASGPAIPSVKTADIFPPDPDLSYPDNQVTRTLARILCLLGLLPLPKLIGAGVGMAWYTVAMSQLSYGHAVNRKMSGLQSVVWMWNAELKLVGMVLLLLGVILRLSR
ncbi:FMN-linked oxidoreductase [Dentipellis sp. KUC8613]|nr:FMN-linked oxidoreductase [Dentipellis sp. KUC8613]